MFGLSPLEIGAIVLVGLLLFGRRLPEVGRSLGKGIIEFKRGLKGVEEEVDAQARQPSRPAEPLPPPAPKIQLQTPQGTTMEQDPRVSRSDSVQ